MVNENVARPAEKVGQRIKLNAHLANPLYKPHQNQDDLIIKVDDILDDANEVSQPDS